MTKPANKPQDKRLGDIFVELGFISELQLAEAVSIQQQLNSESQRKFRLGEVLLFKKAITITQLHEGLRAQTAKAAEIRKEVAAIKKRADLIKSFEQQDHDDNDAKTQPKHRSSAPEPKKSFLSFLQKKT